MLKHAGTCTDITKSHLQGSERRWLCVLLIQYCNLKELLKHLTQNSSLLRQGTRGSEISDDCPPDQNFTHNAVFVVFRPVCSPPKGIAFKQALSC